MNNEAFMALMKTCGNPCQHPQLTPASAVAFPRAQPGPCLSEPTHGSKDKASGNAGQAQMHVQQ